MMVGLVMMVGPTAFLNRLTARPIKHIAGLEIKTLENLPLF